jgi:GNAT superfamily N-acetyltransferase
LKPNRRAADWTAVEADRSITAELQAFYEANPAYWMLVHGHAPAADEAASGFDARPPDGMSYGTLPVWLIRDLASGRIVGEVAVATDLLAPGVMHLGFFIVETERHGTGFAVDVYESYEAWAIERGARWLRLGVVDANPRAHAFWRRLGYVEVCRHEDYVLGDLRHSLIVMVKPVGSNTLADYLAAVPRDRPGPRAAARPRDPAN